MQATNTTGEWLYAHGGTLYRVADVLPNSAVVLVAWFKGRFGFGLLSPVGTFDRATRQQCDDAGIPDDAAFRPVADQRTASVN